jgi:hypothetical protein
MAQGSDVSEIHPLQREQLAGWAKLSDLRGGTTAMRAGGEKYLPKSGGETPSAWTARRDRTFLFPGYDLAVKNLAGKPFLRDVEVARDTSDKLREWAEDITLEGVTLNNFAARAFDTAVDRGMVHVLTDMPTQKRRLSLGEERAMGLRPYAVLVHPDNVLGWRTEMDPGTQIEVLTQLRIAESAWQPVGEFGVELVPRIRVFTRVLPFSRGMRGKYRATGRTTWSLYEQRAQQLSGLPPGTSPRKEWTVIDSGEVSLNRIPLRTLYTHRIDILQSQAPLEELAWKNIEHWQGGSDQNHILHVARVPILWGAGWEKGDLADEEGNPIEIGSSRVLLSSAEGGKAQLGYAEHSGEAISAGRQSLIDIVDEMSFIALRPFVQSSRTTLTATEAMLRVGDQLSDLTVWAGSLEETLELVLNDMGEWMGEEANADVEVFRDFTALSRETAALIDARKNKDLSQETYLEELQRRGLLSEEWDYKREKIRLKSEEPTPEEIAAQRAQFGTGEPAVPPNGQGNMGGLAS